MALTYALYELAQHPDLQQKVVDEVDKFGRARIPSFDDLACFPYIDAVFKEAMRLHPPVTPIVALVISKTCVTPVLAQACKTPCDRVR